MKLNIKFKQWMALLLAVVAVSFAACSDDDDDAVSGQVVFEAFGPSPALRGSDLTFIGRNMDQVTSVILPEDIEITAIEVVSNEKIKVTIPQNAGVGYVKLQTPNGTLTSKTVLSYIEPISISSIAPNPVKAGQTLTIEGDYLNLMHKVIFADGVEVMSKDFTKWERASIQLVVPREAQTGTITLADTAAIPVELESEQELAVVLPSVASVETFADKKPADAIEVAGADLDLVEHIVLANSDTIDFTVEENTISFVLPEGTTDGTINMIAYSGVHVPVAEVTMAVPTELVAAPVVDLRNGDLITVSGANMDLVTTVAFPGVANAVNPESVAADQITVLVPEGAISGTVILNTASGNTAGFEIETQKPAVSAYNPDPVSAGNELIIEGANLDLVVSVTFAGDQTVEVTPASATSLTVAVPVDAESGELVLTMANGETVTAPLLTVEKPEFCYVPVLPDAETEINAGTVLTLDVKNEDKLTDVKVNGTTTQFILEGTKLYVLIPNDAGGQTDLQLVSSNGDITYQLDVIGSSTKETVVYQGPLSLTWGDGGRVFVSDAAFEGVSAGSILKIYFTQNDNWGQAQINNGGWAVIPFAELNNDGYMTTDTYGDKAVSEQELVLTQDVLDNITANASSGNALIIQGSDWIISKISIITSAAASETIWEGEQAMGNWASWVQLSADLFATAKVGKTLTLTIKDQDAGVDYWQVAVKNGSSWGDIQIFDVAQDATTVEMPITADLLAVMQDVGLIFSGYSYTLTKVEIK
ncbi:IPT/TIG domain-containing protein [Mangrovibacterium marinum]|uniref:IPT/TIG domain-containing protein n=1 Tax=Mangrovibacterium marinum TaxID=1639118 RepID=A0A2T5C5F9_9BACT|nr:IPT/TIG domain-containing protein [Mangrovibacterium marinum]PTN10135.1 IPT/TIG domain-containing protein [Mangrovibacterium marinum]